MKYDIGKPFAFVVIAGLLSACVLVSEKTLIPTVVIIPTETPELVPTFPPTQTLVLLPTDTVDPTQFFITTEIDQPATNEEIMSILFSLWLDHLKSTEVSPYWRIEAYSIKDIFELSLDLVCAQKLGASFLLQVEVDVKTTDPLLCTTECQHSAWVAGGGNILDDFHITKPFSGAVFKSGNKYILRVITAVPPC
jgi:hypothetical protein